MSQEHASHEGPIKTPKQLIVAVVFSFLVPIVLIIMLVNYVASSGRTGAGSDAMTAEATARRIQPIGEVTLAADSGGAKGLLSGEEVFKARCSGCHAAGVMGAPKFGDAGAWGPRIAQGFDTLWHSALKGKNAMPAQGGGEFSDVEVARAVVYMANAGGAKFPEPKAPAGAAGGDAAKSADAGASAAAPAAAQTAAPAAAASAAAAAATTAAPAAAVVAKADAAGAPPALYQSVCMACHASGAAGAPKLGDKAAWAPRLAAGIDGLTASAIKGKNAMPPKGGAVNATEAEIKAVVTYMVNNAK